jgi:hypothetical protein
LSSPNICNRIVGPLVDIIRNLAFLPSHSEKSMNRGAPADQGPFNPARTRGRFVRVDGVANPRSQSPGHRHTILNKFVGGIGQQARGKSRRHLSLWSNFKRVRHVTVLEPGTAKEFRLGLASTASYPAPSHISASGVDRSNLGSLKCSEKRIARMASIER